MTIRFLYIFVFIILTSTIIKASDTFADVKEKADEHMKKVLSSSGLEDIPPSLLASLNEYSSNTSLSRESYIHKISGLMKDVPVISAETFRSQKVAFQDRLMHAFQAAISLLSDYLHNLKEDQDSLTWTFEHFPLPGRNSTLPLEGMMILDENKIVLHAHLYELQRQKYYLEIITLRDLMIAWKKAIFPGSTINSYQAINAQAINPVFLTLLIMRDKGLENAKNVSESLYPEIRNAFIEYCSLIVSILEDLLIALPEEGNHQLVRIERMRRLGSQQILKERKKKFDQYDNQRKLKRAEFTASFETTFENAHKLTKALEACMGAPGNKKLLTNLHNLYAIYINHRVFNFPGIRMRFQGDVLDLERLMPENITFTPEEFHFQEDKQFVPPSIEGGANQKLLTHSLLSDKKASNEKGKEKEKENVQVPNLSLMPSDGEEIKAEENVIEEVIYDADYWKKENEFHRRRKQQESETIHAKVCLTPYQIDLFSFLRDNIFTIKEHLKVRELKSTLSQLYFNVQVNKKGNGSIHHVSPKSTNPLFGDDEYYKNAYFVVHLPHEDELIPFGYYRFLRSGFTNVFGLNFDLVSSQLRLSEEEN